MQISQLLNVQIQKFLCLSYREFPEFSRTHLTLFCKSISNASMRLQTKRTCYLTGLVVAFNKIKTRLVTRCDLNLWLSWSVGFLSNLKGSERCKRCKRFKGLNNRQLIILTIEMLLHLKKVH